jgi:hypothetical protein
VSGFLSKASFFWHRGDHVRRARLVLSVVATGLVVLLVAIPQPGPDVDPAKLGQWWGALAALALILMLAFSAPWWMRTPQPRQRNIPRSPAPHWFWPLVAIAMLSTAVMGSMRLNHDLWDDEELTLRRFVQGSYRPLKDADDGRVEFREVGAGRTFHDYKKPNNHILHSILARASVAVWKTFRSSTNAPFSEMALRIPAFLFGIASVAVIALLLKELGLARAGVWAAFILALHPWHIRYASEARGYSMVLFFLPLLIVFSLRAIRDGRWSWWVATAATSFALLYTYPATLYPVAFLYLIGLFMIFGHRAWPDTQTSLARWFASSTAAASLFIVLFSPCIPQLLEYLDRDGSRGNIGYWWLREFGSQLFAGMAWFKSKNLAAPQPELFAAATQNPEIFRIVLLAAVLFTTIGTIRLVVRGLSSAAVALTLTLPGVLAYFAAVRSGTFLYEWYLIYLLPGVIVLLAAGIDLTGKPFRRYKWNFLVPATVFGLLVCGYSWLTRDARHWLLSRPLQPTKQSVLLTRESTLPNYSGHDSVITASFNTPAFLYDPHGLRIGTMEELRALMKQSEARGVPLYLNVGNPWAASYHQPEMFKLMTDSESFQVVAHLPGYDPTLDRIVARYVPQSP